MFRSATRMMGICLVLAVSSSSAYAAQDVVVLKGNRGRTEGKVISDDMNGVVVRVGRGVGKATYSNDQVEEVIYDGTPQEFNFGKGAMKSGNFEEAVNHFQSALDRPVPDGLKQYIYYYMGRCQIKVKDYKGGIESFSKLHEMGDKTRFKVEANTNLINLHLEVGNVREVTKLLRTIGTGNSRSEKVAILTIKGKVDEKSKKYSSALSTYKRAIDAAGPDAELAVDAELGTVRCMLGLRKHRDAIQRLNSLMRRARSDRFYAEAYLLLGDAFKETAQSPEDYEKALLAYLRVPALYGGQEETEGRALLEAAACYRQIPGGSSKTRANKLLALLRRKYPDSEYAKRAR